MVSRLEKRKKENKPVGLGLFGRVWGKEEKIKKNPKGGGAPAAAFG